MKFIKHRGILLFGFSLITFFVILLSLTGALSLKKTNGLFEQTYNNSFAGLVETERANANLIAVHRAMKDVALSKNASQLQTALNDVNKYDLNVNECFENLNIINPNNIYLDEVVKAYKDWEPIRTKTLEYAKNNQYDLAAENTRTVGAAQVNLISEKMQLLIDYNKKQAQIAFDLSQTTSHKSLTILLWLACLSFALTVLIFLFISRKLFNYENNLHNEKEQLRITFESIGDGVITTDINKNVIKLNKAAQEMTGWNSTEAFGKPFLEVFNIISALTGEKAKDPVEEVLSNDQICELENHTILLSKDGTKRHIADSAAPIKEEDGATIGVVMVFRDVTEKKNAENLLRASEEKYRLLNENISDVISVLDLKTMKITYVSPSIYQLRGFTPEEVMNEKIEDSLTPESFVTVKNNIKTNIKEFLACPNEQKCFIHEVEQRCKNGKNVWVESSMRFKYNLHGDIEVICVSRNIEQRKKMEQELETAQILMQAAFDQSPVVMAVATYPDCMFKIINKAAEDFLLINKADFIGKTFDDVKKTWKYQLPDGKCIAPNEFPLRLTMDGITTKNMEIVIERHDGTRRWQLCSASPIFDNNGKLIAGITVMPDITELKKAEENLKESQNMLLESQKVAHIGSYVNDVVNRTWTSSTELYVIFGIDEKYQRTLEGWANIVHPDWREKLFNYATKVYSEKTRFDLQYKIVRVNDGEERWVHGLGNLEFDENGNTIKMIGTIQDITERKIKDEEIMYRSSHDILTGLYNRRKFEEIFDIVEDSNEVPVSIIVGDVNGLKLINDAYGHSAGDIILKKISHIIQEVCGDAVCAARRGGDEFAIILRGVTYEEADLKIMQIKKRCTEESEDELMLTITFGVGTKTKKEQSLEKIQFLAEERMYTNKLLEGKNIRSSIVENLRLVLEEKTGETHNHCSRMSKMSEKIGKVMGFQEFEISNLKLLSLLHDIGKTAIPESILLKPGKLDKDEFTIIQKHCEIGYRIANTMPELVPIAEGILCHHEKWEGKGYPQGLEGDSIPIMSRIVSVLDTYDAMTNDRPYRKALSEEEAIAELRRCSGTQFDPEIVNIFLEDVLNE